MKGLCLERSAGGERNSMCAEIRAARARMRMAEMRILGEKIAGIWVVLGLRFRARGLWAGDIVLGSEGVKREKDMCSE